VKTILEAIATGNPPTRCRQADAARFMQQVEGSPERLRRRLPAIYEKTGIDFRYSAVEDYDRAPEDFTFYPKHWDGEAPSTAQRNQKYREAAVPLAERVAGEALDEAALAPDAVTHLIAVSCTGFFAPGLDIELVKRLGLPPTTQRTLIGFMGCYAAFNAMRAAHHICQSQENARVLVVCVELCTLHFQISQTVRSAAVNALFSDGAAAAVFSSKDDDEAAGELAYAGGHTLLDDDSMEEMTWEIGDTGFLMGLTSRVPKLIAGHLPGYVRALLQDEAGVADVDFWAIHPGGRAIVEQAQETLGLSDEQVADSFDVLRRHGNMSSPTVLFILQRFLERHQQARAAGEEGFEQGVAMAFGPGLTLEGARFERVQ
jgi:predicted naringenin-chalcone synthase